MTTLILEAYAKGDGAGPSWARLVLVPEYMQHIEHLSNLCTENSIHSVTTLEGPDEWDNEVDLRLRGDELVISGTSLWLECCPKHGSYECETRITEIDTLRKAMVGESDGESIVEGDIVFQNRTVKEAYTEWLADQNTGEDA